MGIIVGTAGHIDHGKSALVQALTGQDPDRLAEEKRRGITIELGYVFMPLPDGNNLVFIDVPGHEKFIRQMVAGITTVDLFLLVIAADEGIMPQTREHFDILRLLGVNRGVVAVTKSDLVDSEFMELVMDEIAGFLHETPAENSCILPVSSVTGKGLENLRSELIKLVEDTETRETGKFFRLAIDRVFTLKGHGTVVAGTALSGTVSEGDTVELQPLGKSFRIREIHVNFKRDVKKGSAGDRIALNLVGLEKDMVSRGDCLGSPGFLHASKSLDAECCMLKWKGADLKYRQRIRFHTGTAEVMARAIPITGKTISPGSRDYVHFQLETPVVFLPGDPFVIRKYSPTVTIGGGNILESGSRKVRNRFRTERKDHLEKLAERNLSGILESRLSGSGLIILDAAGLGRDLNLETREINIAVEEVVKNGIAVIVSDGSSDKLISGEQMKKLRKKMLKWLEEYHSEHSFSSGMPTSGLARIFSGDVPAWLVKDVLNNLMNNGLVQRRNGRLALSSQPAELTDSQQKKLSELRKLVFSRGVSCLSDKEAGDNELVEAAIEHRYIFSLGEGLLSTGEIKNQVVEAIRSAFGETGFRLGEVRETIGVSRKIALAWVEHLDSVNKTRRKDDLRFLI